MIWKYEVGRRSVGAESSQARCFSSATNHHQDDTHQCGHLNSDEGKFLENVKSKKINLVWTKQLIHDNLRNQPPSLEVICHPRDHHPSLSHKQVGDDLDPCCAGQQQLC
jgi:hypothetical protein